MRISALAAGVLCATLVSSASFAGSEIIVESCPGGQNVEGFKVVEGNWMDSSGKSKVPGLQATQSKFMTAGKKAGTVRFTPQIPSDGKYQVFVTFCPSGNAAGVIYKIHCAEGDKQVTQDQNGRGAKSANVWNPLGTFSFKQGKDGYVEISDAGTGAPANPKDTNARVYADAISFVPEGSTPSGPVASATAPAAEAAKPASPALGAAAGASPAGSSAPSLAGALAPESASSSKLPSLPGAAGSAAPSSASPTPSSSPAGLASLGSALGNSPAASTMPSLTGSSTPASGAQPSLAGMPSLSAAAAPSTPSAPASGASTGSAGLPSLANAMGPSAATAPGSTATQPPLPPLATGAAAPEASQTPAAGAATAPAGLAALPNLGSSQPSPAAAGSSNPFGAAALGTPAASAAPADASASAASPLATGAAVASPAAQSGELPWFRDFFSAQASAKQNSKKILVFFEAKGSRVVARYDKEYLSSPAVRSVLESYVLCRIDFPQNTKLGYQLDVFAAGVIAITDANGKKENVILEIPANPEELAKRLQALK